MYKDRPADELAIHSIYQHHHLYLGYHHPREHRLTDPRGHFAAQMDLVSKKPAIERYDAI